MSVRFLLIIAFLVLNTSVLGDELPEIAIRPRIRTYDETYTVQVPQLQTRQVRRCICVNGRWQWVIFQEGITVMVLEQRTRTVRLAAPPTSQKAGVVWIADDYFALPVPQSAGAIGRKIEAIMVTELAGFVSPNDIQRNPDGTNPNANFPVRVDAPTSPIEYEVVVESEPSLKQLKINVYALEENQNTIAARNAANRLYFAIKSGLLAP